MKPKNGRHPSGSIDAQFDRRDEYRLASGAVSNPGDGRMRKAERRRLNAARRIAAKEAK